MATFTFPYWAKPVLDFYNLSWPDVDEDAIADLGHRIERLAGDAWVFTIAVKSALGALAEASDSEALTAFHEDWGSLADGPFQSVTETVGAGAVATTLGVANGITVYKGSLLGILTLNVGSDIALIATGVGAGAVVVKKAVMREVLELAIGELTRHTAAWLVDEWNGAVDSLILGPLERLATEIGTDLGGSIRRVVTMSVPTDVIAAPAARLYIDHHDVMDAVGRLATALHRLLDSAEDLRSWSKGSGYTSPTPVPDPTLRIALKEAFDWAADAFVGQLKQMAYDIVDRVVDVVTETYEKYQEADAELGRMAARLKAELVLPIPTQPYVIDRTERPQPLMKVDAPPPVITGQAVSDARADIATSAPLETPEPVLTGTAESDARQLIRDLVLPDAPEVVRTGVAESDASDHIRPV